MLVHLDDDGVRVPSRADGLTTIREHSLGDLHGRPCITAEVPAGAGAPEGMAFQGLRALHGRIDPGLWRMAGRSFQVVEWDRTHQFCGRCGSPTEVQPEERARKCPQCGMLHFPRVSPAVIMLIRRGDELLLARSFNFPPGRYSVLAGFVDPGETLEEAVVREAAEEVGIAVKNVRYFGSQPWPFPHSIMIGFTADYAGGELRLQEKEIEDAGWYRVDNLPELPPPYSIARTLIDSWIVEQKKRGSP